MGEVRNKISTLPYLNYIPGTLDAHTISNKISLCSSRIFNLTQFTTNTYEYEHIYVNTQENQVRNLKKIRISADEMYGIILIALHWITNSKYETPNYKSKL